VKIHAWSVPVFLAGLAMSATNACAAPTITYFDVPGGSIGSAKIDNAGEISGVYLGSDGNDHDTDALPAARSRHSMRRAPTSLFLKTSAKAS